MKRILPSYPVAILLILLIGVSCGKKNPVIEIQTPKGVIAVELYPGQAPVTAAHFLKLVEEKVFDGSSFYRTVRGTNDANPVRINVLQGGLQEKAEKAGIPRIPHETTGTTGIKHLNGVISMARSEPGSASTEFFICVGDQPELNQGGRRNPDGQGFAAFGKVIEGLDVVEKIWMGPAAGQSIDPPVLIHKMMVR